MATLPLIVANTPAGTQAAMIAAALATSHSYELATVASRFQVTLQDLQTILKTAGYPDEQRMRTAVARLQAEAVELADQADTDAAVAATISNADTPELVTSSTPMYARVAVDQLHADPDNLREHVNGNRPTDYSPAAGDSTVADDIEQLADSIREVGLLQPIVARRADAPDGTSRLIVVAGHRRLAAIKRLRWTHVDVVIRPPMRPDHVIAAMLIENGQRRDLDPIEEARGIRKLKASEDLTDLALARKIGRSQSYVSHRLALLNLTAEEQEQVRNGEMGRTAAADLGRLRAGKVRQGSKGNITIPFLGPTHELAPRAAARCRRLGHSGKLAGGVACGPCWESVLRADERDHLHVLNAKANDCVTCGQPIDHAEGDHR